MNLIFKFLILLNIFFINLFNRKRNLQFKSKEDLILEKYSLEHKKAMIGTKILVIDLQIMCKKLEKILDNKQ